MNTLQELQEKQAKELQEFNLEQTAKENLPGISLWVKIGWKTKFDLRIDLTKTAAEEIPDIIAKVIDLYPPTGEMHPIYDCTYYFNFKNPCKYEYGIDFCYMSNGISIDFNLPLNAVDKDLIHTGSRKITDCEYHYFTGMTINEMRKIEFRTYQLNTGILKQPHISYFGGSKSYKTNFTEDFETILTTVLKAKTN